jgi:hypothetical protein
MKEIVSAASEAELGSLFHAAKEACPLHICLKELSHPQPPSPLQTDNTTATGIATDTIKQKQSKAIDMHFYWIWDHIKQKQYHVYWCLAEGNKVDYFTKHHSAKHNHAIHPLYLHQSNFANDISSNYYSMLD